MDTLDEFLMSRPPTPARPLLGVTVLVVEDSRYACDALRLLCLRSGARIRRADSLANARRHLRVYRPTCVIVDMGLPDGPGEELLAELSGATPAVDVLLATSGDPSAESSAVAAGAMQFLPKPLTSLAEFQTAILSRLPSDRQPSGPRAIPREVVDPDPLAFRDDLLSVSGLLSDLGDDQSSEAVNYAVRFLAGLALSAGDTPLARAASDIDRATDRAAALARLKALIEARIRDAATV
ncbi:response regulator [Pelagovum pacificum]|uniref:Response regulator n=1 Tax=Pelagovum pacificum TaxID=2588711 RepID=A0A5C5GHM9_9RHOB|nr:response regulator [Pelagovum pacificum]QQA43244.1 response regulator [Pelagovum pacificum]TNY33617.1 response regulator [Pelagovum pacificum]